MQYIVDPVTHRIDYDQVRDLARKERPKLIFSGATAYPREFDFKAFGDIAKEVGARFVADIAHIAGLIVAGVHQSPIPYADAVMTTTHKSLRGPRGAMILCQAEHAEAIDRAVFPALQGGPHNHTTAAIAVALREASTPEFQAYGRQIVHNAKALAEALLSHGFTLISGGTDNHLILIDMTSKGVTGKQASRALAMAGIETNANTIPYDPRRPFDPSGVRIGTPAVTSRGMQEVEMQRIAAWIDQVVSDVKNEAEHARIRAEVRDFAKPSPVPAFASEGPMPSRIEVSFKPEYRDPLGESVQRGIVEDLGLSVDKVRTIEVYTIDAGLTPQEVERVRRELFTDPIIQQSSAVSRLARDFSWIIEVGFRPGVTDNVGKTAREGIEAGVGPSSWPRMQRSTRPGNIYSRVG